MTSKLIKITPEYHTFVANQVLTEKQLNEFVAYADDQSRLAKVFLHGVGVVCGFSIKRNKSLLIGGRGRTDSFITITQGVGITTDGDLLQLVKAAGNEKLEIVKDTEKYTHYKKFTDKKEEYEPFKTKNGFVDMWELFPESGDNASKLNNLKLDDKVVVLYLESYAKEGNLCTAIDCDNQGTKEVQKLRVLLVNEKDIPQIIKNDELFKWHNIVEKYTQLPEIKLPRINLWNVKNAATLKQSFTSVLSQTLISNLKEGFATIFQIFGQAAVSAKIASLLQFNKIQLTNLNDFQYRYDLLADLIDTYNEIKELLLHINVECCPPINSFPKHLLLGKFDDDGIYKTFRHRMYKSPLSASEQFNRSKVDSLILRVQQLLENYKFNLTENEQAIRITPSLLNGELGQRAIPFYYSINSRLLNAWSYEKASQLKQKYNLSYWVEKLANLPEFRNPLQFNTDEFNFLRIEGHLKLDAVACCDQIKAQIKMNGLDLLCQVVNLDDDENSFATFLKKHPQLEHRAGSVKGGTFILVAEDNIVLADLFVPYRVVAELGHQDYSLMECSFPWISSLKYLNNLARSTKGTQSRNMVMPKYYKLQVLEYRINGQNLINDGITISIPLQKIFLRRIHAITEALNARFGSGLVFDFNESQKRFVITRVKEDSFVLRLRDVTLGATNPIYSYSNKGMLRNNNVFRKNAMLCRDLRKYKPEFYEALQEKIAPLNKDDDYGKFNDKWKKWSILKERLLKFKGIRMNRMITQFSELPKVIQGNVETLKADFQKIADNDLQFKLDGDWVNGEWVDNDMLDYYKKNKKNTHNDLVLFVNLRKYLHSETGATKLSIYITNLEYNDDFDEVIKKHKGFADIYFGAPSGENAIKL